MVGGGPPCQRPRAEKARRPAPPAPSAGPERKPTLGRRPAGCQPGRAPGRGPFAPTRADSARPPAGFGSTRGRRPPGDRRRPRPNSSESALVGGGPQGPESARRNAPGARRPTGSLRGPRFSMPQSFPGFASRTHATLFPINTCQPRSRLGPPRRKRLEGRSHVAAPPESPPPSEAGVSGPGPRPYLKSPEKPTSAMVPTRESTVPGLEFRSLPSWAPKVPQRLPRGGAPAPPRLSTKPPPPARPPPGQGTGPCPERRPARPWPPALPQRPGPGVHRDVPPAAWAGLSPNQFGPKCWGPGSQRRRGGDGQSQVNPARPPELESLKNGRPAPPPGKQARRKPRGTR